METKRELLKEVREYAPSDLHTKVVRLLNACIRDLRTKNDTATLEDVSRNQGAISELKGILKGISINEKFQEYTGGFDE